MQSIYAYNLITILNCARIKYLSQTQRTSCNFYNVPFWELDELDIEHVVKTAGLYPIPFFALNSIDRDNHSTEVKSIRNLWLGVHLMTPEHVLTFNSKLQNPSELTHPICLTHANWDLLQSRYLDPVYIVRRALNATHKLNKNSDLPPRSAEHSQHFSRLLSSPLPNDIVALICDVHEKLVRELREVLYPGRDFPRKTFVQKRILERHAFDRFALFIGICLYEFLVRKGLSNILAFLRTIEALEHSPTIKVNQFEDCHLAVNLYHWLTVHELLPLHSQIEKRAKLQDFPQNFRDFIEYHPKLKIPPIRKMGIFPIPDSLDKEHKTLLVAINNAILNHCSLKPLLQKYYEGGFQ